MKDNLVTREPPPSTDPPPPVIHPDFINALQLSSLGKQNKKDSPQKEESPPPPAN